MYSVGSRPAKAKRKMACGSACAHCRYFMGVPLWKVVPCSPLASLPTVLGKKSTSGQRVRTLPHVMMLPSSSSYIFYLSELSVVAFTSVAKSRAM